MGLSSIVNVVISRQTAAVAQAGFGVALILGSSARITGDKVRTFSSIEAVEAVFMAGDPELVAAGKYFGQSVKPESLKIAQRDADRKQKYTVTVATVANSTAYTDTINGVANTFTSDSSATNLEIAAGLVAAINGGAQAANVTAVDGMDGTYTVEADVAGIAFTQTLTSNLTHVLTTANRNLASELALIVLEDNEWYALLNTSHLKADILAGAAYIESKDKIYIAASQDADLFTGATTDVMTALAAASYDRTALLAIQDASAYPEAAWAGRQLPQAPGSSTWAFKTLAGITVDSLNDDQVSNVSTKGANIYIPVGGRNVTVGKNNGGIMASGEFIDIIIGVDYLKARISENVFGKIVNLEKIPYTDGGVLVVTEAVQSVLNGAVPNILAADPAPSVTAPLVANISSNDKAVRKLPDVKFKGTLSGAIHKTEIAGTVVL